MYINIISLNDLHTTVEYSAGIMVAVGAAVAVVGIIVVVIGIVVDTVGVIVMVDGDDIFGDVGQERDCFLCVCGSIRGCCNCGDDSASDERGEGEGECEYECDEGVE